MVIITEQDKIQEYFESPALGQSTLKKLLGNLSGYHKEVDSSASHFVLGSAVDCILTAEEGEFERQYYVSNIERKPSDTIVAILNIVHTKVLEDYQEYLSTVIAPIGGVEEDCGWENLESNEKTGFVTEPVQISSFLEFVGRLANWETYLLEAALELDWQRTWGEAAKIKNLTTDVAEEYFLDLCQSYGKTIIDATQNQTIWNVVRSLRNNPRTARFFNREAFDNPLVEVYYQFPIYFEYKGVQCKALMDMVIVEKAIATFVAGEEVAPYIMSITPIDFKTMFDDTYNFMASLKLRRYDIQAAWYTLALYKCFGISEESHNIIKPFLFVVESTSFQGKPLTYELTEEVLNIGRYGREAVQLVDTNLFGSQSTQTVLQRKVLGFEELLDLYLFYQTNGWHEEKLIQVSGVKPILLTWDGIVDMS